MLFASVHTDPTTYYPYFSGYAAERGAGEGFGANLNVPRCSRKRRRNLSRSRRRNLVEACAGLQDRGARGVGRLGRPPRRPAILLDVSTDAFARVGELLADLQLPTLIVQEGGYSLEASENAAAAFISAFCSRHKGPRRDVTSTNVQQNWSVKMRHSYLGAGLALYSVIAVASTTSPAFALDKVRAWAGARA